MGYYRRPRHNHRNFSNSHGGYDPTGRWRSEAWHMDGGANDEGWHHKYCPVCNKETEHGRQSTGSYCVKCDDRSRYYKRSHKKSVDDNPHKRDRWCVLKLYEVAAGSLNPFLESLRDHNEKRCLSQKQLDVGALVISKVLDVEIVETYWSHIREKNESTPVEVNEIVRLESAVNPMKVLEIDPNSNQVYLEGLESGSKFWAPNDSRWKSMS